MEILLIVAATVLAVALSYVVKTNERVLRCARFSAGRRGEVRVGQALDEVGAWDRLDDVVLGPTVKRLAQVDHLVRCADRLVVLETKTWSGVVAGGVADPHWTVTRDSGEVRRMRNPIAQAQRQARIVAEAAGGGVTVGHLVVMAGRSRPADGAFPPGVLPVRLLGREMRLMLGNRDNVPPDCGKRVDEAWTKLVEDTFAPDAAQRAARYVASLDARFSEKPWRAWLLAALAFSVLAYSMGMLENSIRNGTAAIFN